jgi:hypothetical protein
MAIEVYNSSISSQLWYTDKCRISTTGTAVTYQVYATALGNATAEGNIYSNNESIGANETKYIYVGVGNYLTITGSGFTAVAIGTASSAQAGSGNFTEQFIPAPAPVTSNIILYYDPSNSASYPGTGTTIDSLASPNLAGTMSNITYTDPYFTYNGTSSQISVADTVALEPGSGSWTMEAWVNKTASGNDVVLGKFSPGGAAQHASYSIRTTGTSYYAQLGSGSGSGATLFVDSTTFVGTLNAWYQLVYVFKNGATKTLETFVNGSSIGTVNHSLASILNTATDLYIGSYNGGEYSQWFDGRIGIVRLYNAALTTAEVQQNFDANRAIYGI